MRNQMMNQGQRRGQGCQGRGQGQGRRNQQGFGRGMCRKRGMNQQNQDIQIDTPQGMGRKNRWN